MRMYFEYNQRGFANECSVYYALPSHKGTVKKVEELISSSPCAALRRISAKEAYKYERRHHHRDYPLPCVTQLLRELLGYE